MHIIQCVNTSLTILVITVINTKEWVPRGQCSIEVDIVAGVKHSQTSTYILQKSNLSIFTFKLGTSTTFHSCMYYVRKKKMLTLELKYAYKQTL